MDSLMGMAALVDAGDIMSDVPIGARTTYKLGGRARWAADVESVDSLISVIGVARLADVEVLVLGRGSNVLVSDDGFDGLVVRLEGAFRLVEIDEDGRVEAGAGVPLPHLARSAAQAGLAGAEFYVGIPGSVGGAVTMNAGFAGGETADILVQATVMNQHNATTSVLQAVDLAFSYRNSAIGSEDIVLGATFQLTAGDVDASLARMRQVTQWRKERQPGGTFNAGSVFKNPPGDHAGRLIDDLGLKGHTVGSAHVSQRHANFFVADGDATAQDVYDLVHSIRRSVHESEGVLLEPELRFVGQFRQSRDEVS